MLLLLTHSLLIVVLVLVRVHLLRGWLLLRVRLWSLSVVVSVSVNRLLLLREIVHLLVVLLFLRPWSSPGFCSARSFRSRFSFLVSDLRFFMFLFRE